MPARFGIPDAVAASSCRSSASASGGSSSRFRCSGACRSRRARSKPMRRASGNPVRAAFVRVWETFHELRGYRQAFLMLVAFLLYNDGIQTIIRMAAIYGAEIGIDQNAQIAAFVLVQFVGIPFSFLFGALAGRDRREDGDLPRARRLHRHQRARLLHDDGVAVLRARVPGRHGAGRQPGAQPLALRAHDPEAQVVGVLRLLLGLREVRRHRRAGAVCGVGQHLRIEPRRGAVGDPLLRLRRASS